MVADSSADEESRHKNNDNHKSNTPPTSSIPAEASVATAAGANDENLPSGLTASELRERLLREKVKALRKSSHSKAVPSADGA
ncbi:hypothetical protein ACLMJK_006821 [Lecanora helva]